jgi:hypothetical protein
VFFFLTVARANLREAGVIEPCFLAQHQLSLHPMLRKSRVEHSADFVVMSQASCHTARAGG